MAYDCHDFISSFLHGMARRPLFRRSNAKGFVFDSRSSYTLAISLAELESTIFYSFILIY